MPVRSNPAAYVNRTHGGDDRVTVVGKFESSAPGSGVEGDAFGGQQRGGQMALSGDADLHEIAGREMKVVENEGRVSLSHGDGRLGGLIFCGCGSSRLEFDVTAARLFNRELFDHLKLALVEQLKVFLLERADRVGPFVTHDDRH